LALSRCTSKHWRPMSRRRHTARDISPPPMFANGEHLPSPTARRPPRHGRLQQPGSDPTLARPQARPVPATVRCPLVARHTVIREQGSAECRIVIHALDEVLQVSYEVVGSLLKPGAWAEPTLYKRHRC